MKTEQSKKMQNYFLEIEDKIKEAYNIADKARKKGYDPEEKTEIPLAKNAAERVEGLISAIAPQIKNSGLSERIPELEEKFGKLDWRVALTISLEVAQEKFCKFNDRKEAIETGIRVGLAYITLGIVASPLEGFVEIKIKQRRDGKDYICLMYSGPIRSAGGTGASVSVIIADYLRKAFGFDIYDPTNQEIERMAAELYDYHERITNLQYLPSPQEIRFLVKNMPLEIGGDATENLEVSNYKDLARIETNNIRSGPCLVIGECIAQKAQKIWKQLSGWGEEFNLSNWFFLKDFLTIQKNVKSKSTSTTRKVNPVYTYIEDLIAGRPVLTHPLRVGGFRLRYGRSRASGYSSASIHPATMAITNRYLATGTQLKVERPGKATAISCCDAIEGPIVKLKNCSVVRIDSSKEVRKLGEIEEILFLGDILFSYGDFFNRAHTLLPAGYCEEWWGLELEKATVNLFGSLDLEKLSELVELPATLLEDVMKKPITKKINFETAIILSKKLGVSLHPRYTYYWSTITTEEIVHLTEWLDKARVETGNSKIEKIIMPIENRGKRTLELLGVPHLLTGGFVVVEKDDAAAFACSFGLSLNTKLSAIKNKITENNGKGPLELINSLSQARIRDKAGIFIGARMGRPEKAKMRKLAGSPHCLFPVGEEGGRLRSFQSTLEACKITAEFPVYYCSKCSKETIFSFCETCGKKTKKGYFCKHCGILDDKCNKKDQSGNQHKSELYRLKEIDIKNIFDSSIKNLGFASYPDLIKGVRGTSNKGHLPEHLIKGILRARRDITVNKDGTTRYDMTQLAITHFKPKEIGTPIEKLVGMGYEKDIHGRKLESDEQIIELKPQDIILPACPDSSELGADKILFRVSLFIDELLAKFYGLEPFYNFKSEQDTIGSLVLALAPHTSAGIVGRVIGFSKTQGFFAHPMFHAATRRDCDGDEASVILLMDALINFSRHFLPNTRGATQDAPLVLTSHLIPSEVDDMVFDMDVAWRYPLEFYEATLEYKKPWEVDIDQIGKRLNTEKQFEGMGFTHDITDINSGVRCSAYKILPSMEEKLKGQMDLAERIRAVDESDVARLVIEKHFLRDIKGNLRKFSVQEFRCVKCNEKYRRPPLVGKCIKCGGRIIFTVSEGSIVKYLEPAISLANKYNLPSYLKQTLELTKRRVEGVFGKEKEKQTGLGAWFG